MAKSFKNPFNNSKLKAFFFFLVLALFFWVLTKFSREYTATVVSNIAYTNIPNNSLLANDNLKELSFDLTETGFEFLFYKLKMPTISINVGSYSDNKTNEISISESELKKIINSQITANATVKNLSVSNLLIKLDSLASKKIKVIPRTDISYKNGYKLVGDITVFPDSIVVTGASEFIAKIDSIETILFSEKKLESSLKANVALRPFENTDIRLDPKLVELTIQVDEFSQKEIILPIEVLNVPKNTTVKLIPKVINVSFSVSLANFKSITEDDFQLVCDYNERNEEENFMIPKLIKKPDGILDIEFNTKKIDYLIFK